MAIDGAVDGSILAVFYCTSLGDLLVQHHMVRLYTLEVWHEHILSNTKVGVNVSDSFQVASPFFSSIVKLYVHRR